MSKKHPFVFTYNGVKTYITCMYLFILIICGLVVNPSEKCEFVNWDDDIPIIYVYISIYGKINILIIIIIIIILLMNIL